MDTIFAITVILIIGYLLSTLVALFLVWCLANMGVYDYEGSIRLAGFLLFIIIGITR